MIVKCILSVSLKNLSAYAGKTSKLPPLPGYITKRGPFIDDSKKEDQRIITIFEFDKSRLAEAYEIISNQLDAFRDIPGFTFFAHRSIVFSEEKGRQFIRSKNEELIEITNEEI